MPRRTLPAAPPSLDAEGRRLWRAVTDDMASAGIELAGADLYELEQACSIADTIDALQRQLEQDGLMVETSRGRHLNNIIAAIRNERIAQARILAAIRVVAVEDDQGHHYERAGARVATLAKLSVAGAAVMRIAIPDALVKGQSRGKEKWRTVHVPIKTPATRKISRRRVSRTLTPKLPTIASVR